MPTYEYRCADCGQHVEVVQSFSDEPLTECGACGGTLKKVFGSVGIVFKGSGFYKTDSRSGSKRSGSSSSSSSDSRSDSKSDSGSSSGSDSGSSDSGSSDSGSSDSGSSKKSSESSSAKSA